MMRKLIGALLAMTALIPAAASAQDGRRGGGGFAGQVDDAARAARRAERRDDRQERRPDAGQRQARADRPQGGERRDRRVDPRGGALPAPQVRDDRQDGRRDRRDDRAGFQNRDRRGDDWTRSSFDGGNDWNRSSFNRDARGNWNRGWRQDRRYDWNGYRSTNRSIYRLPRYYAPYGAGYGYRRFGIGISLQSAFWGSNYWIADPYAYRLPAAYGPYRWVRYYDDALLIDLRSGLVVDTVYDIFW